MGPQPKIIMTPEMEEKFESELLWCIQQLQISLKSGKLNQRQADSTLKSLNTLMGNSPIVKKRQVMRVLFGDYRAKMAEEEKKSYKNNIKVTVESVEPNKNSKCIRKHIPSSKIKVCGEIVKNISEIKIDDSRGHSCSSSSTTFKYVPSNNSFRFNFSVKE